MAAEIHPIFATAIYKNKVRSLEQKELDYVNSILTHSQGLGNHVSNNMYVLDANELTDLKKLILDNIQTYVRDVLCVDNELYITNSWLNFTKTNEQHILHNHTNSIISGCYYIDVDDTQPTISFNRMTPPFLLCMLPKEFNLFNSIEWNIPIKNSTIVIFPSSCYHYVKPNTNSRTRISIAFNTFIKGRVGTNGADHLTLN